MATKISEVLGDADLRATLIAKGQERASTYSWKRMAEQTLLIYEDTLVKTQR
jgi:glycosyltransferase involved in cell wall biosynthesis